MFKQLLLSITLFGISSFCTAQSLTIDAVSNTAGNDVTTFNLKDAKVSLASNQVRFLANNQMLSGYRALGISPDLSLLGTVEGSGTASRVALLTSAGNSLSSYEISGITAGDPSVAIYPSANGEVLVRENIANFSFYDTFGEIITNVSGSSQSEGGESISEVARSKDAETVVIYTPKIKQDGGLGSQARYVDGSMELQSLHYSTDRYIKYLDVSASGQYVVVITSKDDGNDRVKVTDRFGNDLAEISTEENLSKARLSKDAGYVTVNAGNRILVYNLLSGERLGSTSFRSEVITSDYFPADNTILALTGNRSGENGALRDIQLHAINLELRKVERRDYQSAIGIHKALPMYFERTGKYQYLLQGASRKLQVQVSY
jgi:hypothetical protein